MAERRNDPRQIAVINAALCVAGVVTRDGVLEHLLAGSVGFDLKLVSTVENLPTRAKIEAWVQERLDRQPTALGLRRANLHEAQVNKDATALEIVEPFQRFALGGGLALEPQCTLR